jgi:malate synthase
MNLTASTPTEAMHHWLQEKEIQQFLEALHHFGETRRQQLLTNRIELQEHFDAGFRLTLNPKTLPIRSGDWRVTDIPADLSDRRVEITGPPEREIIVNALNSGAQVFVADLEDTFSPSWSNICAGQFNLWQAVRRPIDFRDEERGEAHLSNERTATLMLRPRGWHLNERHINIQGKPMSATLFDTGLFLYLNAHSLIAQGSGPYLYLPKIENQHEAAYWADLLDYLVRSLGIPEGCLKVTVLIETITAAFEMEEILYALRHYVVGMNAGRGNYLFSIIKKFRHDPRFLLPDRSQVGRMEPFMTSFAERLVDVCRRRGAAPIGGMSAFVPSSLDEVNRHAMAEVKADLERVQQLGFVGTWVTHPALVPVAHAVFILESSAIHSTTPAEADGRLHNSQRTGPEEEEEAARDLLRIVEHGPITELGMRNNIRVGLHHLAYWLAGRGAVPIHNQMEDTATAELARAQLWQWLRHRVKLDDGRLCTPELFDTLLHEEIRSLPYALSDKPDALRQLTQATRLFKQLVISMEFEEFLTLPAYELMLIDEQGVNKGLKQVSQRTVQSG